MSVQKNNRESCNLAILRTREYIISLCVSHEQLGETICEKKDLLLLSQSMEYTLMYYTLSMMYIQDSF